MTRMERYLALGTAVVLASLMMSCGAGAFTLATSGNSAAYIDDLYGIHDRVALAKAEKAIAEAEAAAAAAREEKIQAMISAAKAEADLADILSDVELDEATTTVAAGTVINNTYNNIYVDDYESAYARRLKGFSSPTYRLPSSYWDYRYGDAYFLTMAYDPAFYTVMVMGDQVWVEPRYITNMFGGWGRPYYYRYSAFDYRYNPYYYDFYWGPSYYHYGFYDPYFHPWYDSWHGPHYRPGYHPPHHHRPPMAGPGHGPSAGGHKPNKSPVVHRPSYGSGSTARPSGSRPSYADRINSSKGNYSSQGGTTAGRPSGTVSGGSSTSRPSGTSGRVSSSNRGSSNRGTSVSSGSSRTSNRKSSVTRGSSSSSSSSRSSSVSSGRSNSSSRSSSSSYSGSSSRSSSGSSSSGGSSRGGSSSGSRGGGARR